MTRAATQTAWLTEFPIAHRGLHGDAVPENSLAAFARAVAAEVPIELDVRITADGAVIVLHDDNLRRMTGLDRAVAAVTAAEVAELRLAATDERIPRLHEVLDLVGGRVPLLLEVKNRAAVGPLEERVAALLQSYRGPIAVQSFNPFSLDWFRRRHPAIVRGQLAGDFRGVDLAWYRKVLLRNLLFNRWSRPQFISYDVRCLPHAAVTRARLRGTAVLAWTVDTADKLSHARRWADNVIFETIRP